MLLRPDNQIGFILRGNQFDEIRNYQEGLRGFGRNAHCHELEVPGPVLVSVWQPLAGPGQRVHTLIVSDVPVD
jgi:hypothetical protein